MSGKWAWEGSGSVLAFPGSAALEGGGSELPDSL